MPAPELANRKQKAVLWPAIEVGVRNDDYGDHKVSSDKVQINVRWEEKRREAVGALGNSIAIDATVVVDREIAVGSIMWLGKKDDLATPPVNLKEVADYQEIPDVKNRKRRRVVLLVRYSNELPTLV